MGIGDWGLGIGDWAQSPIPNPQSPNYNKYYNLIIIKNKKVYKNKINNLINIYKIFINNIKLKYKF